MSKNNPTGVKTNFIEQLGIPPDQKLSAPEYNNTVDWQNQPVQIVAGSLADTNIVIDGTKSYVTTIAVAGATRTITAALTGHTKGNNIKQRYTFAVDCTITLVNFDATGNNTGIITPIPAGTYDFQYFANENGRNLEISQNITSEVTNKLDKLVTSDQSIESNFRGKKQITIQGKTVTFTATPTFDLDDGNIQEMILTSNVTSLTLSNELDAGSYLIYLIQDGTGGHTIPTPDSTWGDPTDNSVDPANFLTGANDRNLINVAVSPSGFTEFSIETHDI